MTIDHRGWIFIGVLTRFPRRAPFFFFFYVPPPFPFRKLHLHAPPILCCLLIDPNTRVSDSRLIGYHYSGPLFIRPPERTTRILSTNPTSIILIKGPMGQARLPLVPRALPETGLFFFFFISSHFPYKSHDLCEGHSNIALDAPPPKKINAF